MSWVRVYLHMVFSTKNREPFLNSSELRKNVFQHIKKNVSISHPTDHPVSL